MAFFNHGVFSSRFRRFWMIWMEGSGPPTVQHWSEGTVAAEAERLATEHPGRRIHVLESVALVRKTSVQWVPPGDETEIDGVPF